MSDFLKERRKYQPRYPHALARLAALKIRHTPATIITDKTEEDSIKSRFPYTCGQPVVNFSEEGEAVAVALLPRRIAVVLSGGPAPGGHNVIAGLYKGLVQLDERSELRGFLGGPGGILGDKSIAIDEALVDSYLNTGGFDMLGSGRTKIETPEQFARCEDVLLKHHIDGLCIIGGDDSNTNAALLAEHFKKRGVPIQVIGVPKTIDGDLKNSYVATSFGFDTAVRLYSELISNVARDTLSARKYYHIIKLMGRAASHITLEAALLTRPNMALISEEVAAKKQSVHGLVDDICQMIMDRAKRGLNYGIILVPEGVVEFIPEMRALITELNDILAANQNYMLSLRGFTEQIEFVNHKLSKDAAYTLVGLPVDIQRQLLMDRDPHGNVIVSQIETERLLIELVEARLAEAQAKGEYSGSFGYQRHFFGYEGRCAAPTNFDADYAFSLGLTAVALFQAGYTGYMSVVYGLSRPQACWQALGVPLTSLMVIEPRHGLLKPVIKRSVVDLKGAAFSFFASKRKEWAHSDHYQYSGAIQYFGPEGLCDRIPESIKLEDERG